MNTAAPSSIEPQRALRIQIGTAPHIDERSASEVISLTLFELGAQAIGEVAAPEGSVLEAGFASLEAATAAAQALEEHHGSLLQHVEIVEPDVDWVTQQKAGLAPQRVGRWYIRAPWHEPTTNDPAFEVVIDPGAAFGHGGHPSTLLAIELLTRALDSRPRHHVIDIGTGTGVLAIVAARLGATVTAIDNDPAAITSAQANIERNFAGSDIADRIALIEAEAGTTSLEATDLVVANVTAGTHEQLANHFQDHERLIASGLLCRQIRDIQGRYSQHLASTILVNGNWRRSISHRSPP